MPRHAPRMTEALSPADRAWIAKDDELRRLAGDIAQRFGRDAGDIYHTLVQLQRSPAERLERGLRHARIHPKFR